MKKSNSHMKKAAVAIPLSVSLVMAPTISAFAHDHASSESNPKMETMASVTTPASDLRATLDQYLSEHAFLAAFTMQKGIDGAEDFEASAEALNGNTEDLTAAIASVYGDEAGVAFDKMWNDHIGYFVDYVNATAEGDEAGKEEAISQLDNYRADFSEFLEGATDGRLDANELAEGLQEHVHQLIWAFDSYVDEDYDAAYDNLREATHHMYGVGKGLSGAITDQFPEDFDETTPDTPAADLRADLNHLFSEHAGLAAFVMQKGIDGADDFDQAAAALDENTNELSAAIASVYGDEAGDAFKDMWNDHIGYFVDYVTATAEEDEAGREEAIANLDNYRADFSQFLDDATDGRLDATELADGLQMHVNQLVEAFDSYNAGEFETAYDQLREAYGHMFGVGEGVSGAVVDQFPENFEAMPSDMPKTGFGGSENAGFSIQMFSLLAAFLLAGSGLYVLRRKQNA